MQIKKYLSGLVGVEQSKGSADFYQPHIVIATIKLDFFLKKGMYLTNANSFSSFARYPILTSVKFDIQ